MTTRELKFRRSRRCDALKQDGCVEVADGETFVAVQGSTQINRGKQLRFSKAAWQRFVQTL